MKTDECIFCANIPLGEVLIHTYDLFEDEEMAKKIALDSAEMLKKAWLKDRFALCGRSRIGFLAGAVYINSVINGMDKTQEDIAKEFDKTAVTIRRAYTILMNVLGMNAKGFGLAQADRYKNRIQCIRCKNLPRAKNWKTWERKYAFSGGELVFRAICPLTGTELHKGNLSSHRKCKKFEEGFGDHVDGSRRPSIHGAAASGVDALFRKGSLDNPLRLPKERLRLRNFTHLNSN